MNLLELPLDVLVPIIECLTQHDALQLASVSRLARTIAMPRVLSHVDLGREPSHAAYKQSMLQTRSLPKVASFTSLILDNPHAHYAHNVKSLILSWDTIDPINQFSQGYVAHLPTFARALGQATNLRKLEIFKAESVMKLSSALADVFATYVGLKYIRLQDVGARTISVLARTPSRLREVVLEKVHDPFEFDCLRPHAETLEVLRMSDFKTPRPPHDGDVWRRLHTLDLNGFDLPLHIGSFPHAFPHLRLLFLKCGEYRRASVHPATLEPVAWPSIEVLHLSPVCLNLSTPVRVVHVDGDGFSSRFLHYTQPVVLSLDLSHDTAWLPSLQLAPRESFCRLRYLQLRRSKSFRWFIRVTLEMRAIPGPLMDTLIELAKLGLSLQAISVCPAARDQWIPDRDREEEDTPAAHESTAKAIAGLFPTVQLIGLGYQRIGPLTRDMPLEDAPTVWYRVRRLLHDDGDRIVIKAAPPGETADITEYVEKLGRSEE